MLIKSTTKNADKLFVTEIYVTDCPIVTTYDGQTPVIPLLRNA